METLLALVSLWTFGTFQSETEGLARNTHGSHIILTLPIRSFGVGDPCLG